MPNFDDMTIEEIAAWIQAANREIGVRQSREAVDRKVEEIIGQYRAHTPGLAPVEGAKFVRPKGAHDSYLKGETVEVSGQMFESTISCNTCAPTGECAHAAWKKI